ncbi:hypothetical protein [Stakelama pacifica]|uniref:Uncharacterized protein n=1 Tax=Stakelama pacifica TaxID=517720 RepID=A0A4R6FTN8_9SPHN|nr:hypothetical protein [Stakelama pacifica]TDN84560.1 hypothetical protein EV664_103205 [Stakelama pacifica]
MAQTDPEDERRRAARHREFLRAGRSFRIASLIVTIIGGALAIIARDGVVPPWLAIAVIALGAVLMLAGAWSRARFQQKSLSE